MLRTTSQPKRLPPNPLLLKGRDKEKQAVVKSILRHEPCIIRGTGGIGKTDLALVALHDDEVKQKFGLQQYFLSCETSITVQAFYISLADMLGISKEQNSINLQDSILDTLPDLISVHGYVSLCLDNFETVWDPPASRVQVESALSDLAQQPHLSLIVTMRGSTLPHGVRWSDAIADPLPPLSSGDAFAIFQQLSCCLEDDKYARKLVTAAGGVPLVLTLLGSLANGKEETTKEVWHRWQKSTAAASRSDGERNRLMDLDTSVSLSLESPRLKKTPSACLALAVLSLHPGGLAKDSDIVSDLSKTIFPNDSDILHDSLQKLVQTSLANIDEEHKFRLLNPIRHFAFTKLDKLLPYEYAARLVGFYTQFISDHNVYQPSNHDIIRPELGNIEPILRYALSHPKLAMSADLAGAVCSHSEWMAYLGGPSEDAIVQVLENNFLSDQDRAGCYLQLGETYMHLNQLNEAEECLLQAVDLHQQAKDIQGEGADRLRLGELYMLLDRLDEAEESLLQAVKLRQQARDVLGEGSDRTILGQLYMHLDQLDKAEESLLQAVKLHQQAKSLWGEGSDRLRLGELYMRLDRLDEAEESLLQAVKLHQQAKHVLSEGTDRLRLGELYMRLDRLDEAEESLLLAVKLHQQAKGVLGEGSDRARLGELYMRLDRLDEAEESLLQAVKLHQQAKHVLSEGSDRGRLGELYMHLDRLDEAEESLLQAVKLHQQAKHVLSEGSDRLILGEIYMHLDQLDEAKESLLQAIKLHQHAKSVYGEGLDRFRLGEVYMYLDQQHEAKMSLTQAVELFHRAKHLGWETFAREKLEELCKLMTLEKSDLTLF